ncbi:MAG: 4-hydroxy-tetrahydrodipicolinate synthase [Planctomycetota bacterium]
MFKGCLVALVTPFQNGRVDLRKLDELVDWHLEKGTNGIVPCGTTGESPTLSFEEHKEIIERVVKRVGGRVPVVAGTGSNNTAEALELTAFARDVGADGALMITPYYNKPEPEGMFQHFKHIAENVDLPIVLYNVPSRTGRAVAIETIERLSHIPNIVAVKEASLSMQFASEIRQRCDLTILSGEDSHTLPLLSLGATGAISVVANVEPDAVGPMIHAWTSGQPDKALDIHLKYFPLVRALFLETNPIPVKAAMRLMGRLNGEMRLPLSPISPENENKLRSALQDLGLVR